jgi:hypothetical protein
MTRRTSTLPSGIGISSDDGQCLFDVGLVKDAQAFDDLLGLHERPVEEQARVALDDDGRGRVRRPELTPATILPLRYCSLHHSSNR